MNQRESGMTLVELGVAGLIGGLVSLVLMAAVGLAMRTNARTSNEVDTFSLLQQAQARLEKEFREADRVEADSTATSIHLWVDVNANGSLEPAENVTWELVDPDSDGVATLQRRDAAGGRQVVGTEFVMTSAVFTYQPAAPATTSVSLDLTADVGGKAPGEPRRIQSATRLRNAG